MGISVFICPVPNADALKAAIEAVLCHNASDMHSLGVNYTDEEFAVLDPKRHASITALNEQIGAGAAAGWFPGCKEKWTRGEDIKDTGCIVRYRGEEWLEVTNGGGGACTTRWLKSNYPAMGWIGTEGKPNGFMEATVARDGRLSELLM